MGSSAVRALARASLVVAVAGLASCTRPPGGGGTTTTRPTPPTTAPPTTAPSGGGGAGPAVGWNPPANLVDPLAQVWSHNETTRPRDLTFRNFGWDQVMAARGHIRYCVRWDSSARVTAAQRDQVQTALRRQFNKWLTAMTENGKGWNGWPYPSVQVDVTGWAVRDRSQLQWTDAEMPVTVGQINENAPECPKPCGRFFHQDGNYSGCPGGGSHHYDHSLWLTAGFSGGAGGDWGQRIGSEYFMSNLNADNIHILLHEMGHTYGLDDFYDWDPLPGQGFVMKAGSATQITEFDKWMFRDWWRHLKSRYGR